ncbi:unnamed protein product [Eruca vesicaria subsp. sativa]|uniref:Uncharacterized protein n=1 Tax=Eruca vesicaria subsp. sativa TaxID=29727 RepID=A0ABC8JXU4_ERUVS|nr:unnamed protein product [Eruca vesicaria subsp. sativa]
MEHYNTLGEVVYNEKVKHCHFIVKIIRIYTFYSNVTGIGPLHVYVLADEHTEAHFEDPEGPKIVFYIGDNIESQIKCVATGKHAYGFREGFENMGGHRQVIVVLKIWRLQTEGDLSDFRFNPRLPEVEGFRKSANNSDAYVHKYGAIGPL